MKPKKKKPFNANAASVKMLTEEGWTCQVVEYRIPSTWITKDCLGFGDILCVAPGRGIMLVQATGGGNGPSRVKKIRAEARAGIWLASGGRIRVMDWRKRAGQKERVCMVLEITKQENAATPKAP